VLKRYFESSQVVEAGTPILELGDPTSLEVEVDVLSADAVRLRTPACRYGSSAGAKRSPCRGRVRRIEPGGFTKISALGVEEQRVLVIADFTSPAADWQRLGDAYRINARFILWSADEVLRVPTSALFRHRQGWAAFVVEDRRARLRPVSVGQQGGAFSEVRDGLAEGSTVIVHPGRDLADGARVRLRRPPE
jgi:HlyD family secretion protein